MKTGRCSAPKAKETGAGRDGRYTYLVEADGFYRGFTNRNDAVHEAMYRVRSHRCKSVRVTRYAHGDVIWRGGCLV